MLAWEWEARGDSNYTEEGTPILGLVSRFCSVYKTENKYREIDPTTKNIEAPPSPYPQLSIFFAKQLLGKMSTKAHMWRGQGCLILYQVHPANF